MSDRTEPLSDSEWDPFAAALGFESLTIELTHDEVDLLQDCVAEMIAKMLVRYGDQLDQPRVKAKYDGYIEVGRKLGLEL